MKSQFQFLGTGASLGVPVLGCSCEVCRSQDPKNKRLRPAALLTMGEHKILLDCGPDIRQQLLKLGVAWLDGMVLTHAHYDHVEGIDELRALTLKHLHYMPCLVSEDTLNDLKRRFNYIFDMQHSQQIITTRFKTDIFNGDRGEMEFLGHKIRYFTFMQTGMKVQGLRFGNLAYVSDIKDYPDTIFEDLKGVETLIVSALRYTPSMMHFTVDDAIAFAQKVNAKKTWFTHISHDLDHEKTNAYLPPNIQLSYDGLAIDFEE